MSQLPGIYIDGNEEPSYLGCSDNLSVIDEVGLSVDQLESSINEYIPDAMSNSDYRIFSDVLVQEVSQIDANSNLILKCYDLENLDTEMTYKLSSLYNIEYPLTYDIDQLKLLIKNYEKIRRIRGTEKSIRMLLRILERSESSLYEDDTDDTEITLVNPGYYKIFNSRIVNIEFATYMISKVLRSGIQFTMSNTLENP